MKRFSFHVTKLIGILYHGNASNGENWSQALLDKDITGSSAFAFYYRDTLKTIQGLLCRDDVKDNLVFDPVLKFDADGYRVYDECVTSLQFQQLHVMIIHT